LATRSPGSGADGSLNGDEATALFTTPLISSVSDVSSSGGTTSAVSHAKWICGPIFGA
jgi:hypothetical protein